MINYSIIQPKTKLTVQPKIVAFDIDHNRDSIWKTWAVRNLLKGRTVWNCESTAGCSHLWKSVLAAKNELRSKFGGVSFPAERMTMPDGKPRAALIYHYLALNHSVIPWCSLIWAGIQPRKWAFTCWLATRDRLPTRGRMVRWGGVSSGDCVLCGTDIETASHLWFRCSVTNQILDIVLSWLGILTRKPSIRSWWKWFNDCTDRVNNIFRVKLLSFMGVIYYCWRLRNDVIFNNAVVDANRVGNEIIGACKFRIVHKINTDTRRGRAMMKRLIR